MAMGARGLPLKARGRVWMVCTHPIRFYRSQQQRLGDAHIFAPLSRFIPDSIFDRFERWQWPESGAQQLVTLSQPRRIDVAVRMRDTWR